MVTMITVLAPDPDGDLTWCQNSRRVSRILSEQQEGNWREILWRLPFNNLAAAVRSTRCVD